VLTTPIKELFAHAEFLRDHDINLHNLDPKKIIMRGEVLKSITHMQKKVPEFMDELNLNKNVRASLLYKPRDIFVAESLYRALMFAVGLKAAKEDYKPVITHLNVGNIQDAELAGYQLANEAEARRKKR